MDHELLEQKGDFFGDRDDNYSSLKHEFSRIFHENNLHSFTNASDIGFLDVGKLGSQGFSGDYDDARDMTDMDNVIGRNYHKGDASPYVGMNIHNAYSPMRYLNSNVNYSTSYTNVGNMQQKHTPVQDPAYLQTYPGYRYAGDYTSFLDYTPPVNGMMTQNIYDIYSQPDILDSHPNNPLSMMWSNEVGKNMGKGGAVADDYAQMPQPDMTKRYASVPSEQKKIQLKIEQDFDKVSNKSIGLQLDRVAKSVPSAMEVVAPRRTTRVTKPLFNTSTMHDEDEESGSDDDKEDSFGEAKNRSSRGLRVLSLKVRDIVSKKKKTSYKEVAEALLQDLSQKLKGKSQSEIAKEEQNVKRRVYDALNVLIAADILRKEGKLVCCEVSAINIGSQSKKKNKLDKESLMEQLQELKKRRKEKVEALQELIFKSLAIKNLVRRNKEKAEMELMTKKSVGSNALKQKTSTSNAFGRNVNATRIDVVQENASFKQRTEDVISFPFIVLLSSSPENSMNLNMDTTQKQLSIESKKAFNIFGDIDVLLKMRLHYVPREIFDKEVPRELQKYVSHSFTDALK